MKTRPRRTGITLIEVLVVLAIILVLIGLAMPALQLARSAADQVRCANNLHQIGVAYHLFVDSHGGKPSAFGATVSWASDLKPYLDSQDAVFYCTNSADNANSTPWTDFGVYYHPTSTVYPLRSNGVFPLSYGGVPVDLSAIPPDGCYTCPLVLFQDAPLLKLSSRGTYLVLSIKESPTAGGIEMAFYFAVDPQDDGSVFVSNNGEVTTGAGQFDLIRLSTGEVLVSDWVQAASYPQWTTYTAPPPAAGISSYGVNCKGQFLAFGGDSSKVLVVEYKSVVANVVGTGATDDWPTMCAPRHGGMLNVLFQDGSVRNMLPFVDIDPRIQLIYNDYWVPTTLLPQ